MFDSEVLFHDGDAAVSGDGNSDGIQVGPGTYTIEIICQGKTGTWGSAVFKVRESADDITYNDLATFETISGTGVKFRMNVTTEKEYLSLNRVLTTITAITVVSGIVAAANQMT